MKKTTRKQLRTIRRRRLALALVGAMAMPMVPALAQSLPSGGSVIPGTGSATIGQTGSQMTITQTTKGAIIDWNSFNIGAGYGVTFDQQFGTSSVTLNRVIGFGYSGSPTYIEGTLSSNGNVFIINPAGITFGSGAQVNVGGIVASTLWMNQGDFINGLATGQFVFTGFNGDVSDHLVRNFGQITAGAGGVGLVGQTVWNSGSITSNGGNIVAGAGTQVTLDLVGDGLTQVTINVPPTDDSMIVQDRFGTMTADGGRILLRTAETAGGTGGAIYASGELRAQTMANVNGRIELTTNGGVMVGAPGSYSDAGSTFTAGVLDVSGQGGENGGSVLIQGGSVLFVNDDDDDPFDPTDPLSNGAMINASGGVNGGQIDIQASAGILALPLTLIAADGSNGLGGTIRIQAGDDVLLVGTDITAASKITNGGSIGIQSIAGDILASESRLTASGPGNGGDIGLFALQGDLAIGGDAGAFLSADGGENGGSVSGLAQNVLIDDTAEIGADGGSGAGGQVGFRGSISLAAYGLLSARGGSAGGLVITSTDGTFDLRGLQVDAGSAGTAGSWMFSAPDLQVTHGSDIGGTGTPLLGDGLQDEEINTALANGTSVELNSDNSVNFQNGVAIFYDDGTVPLRFQVNAAGYITGNTFSIGSNDAPLSMYFNANADGTGLGSIRFDGATLESSGGDIAFYGESDVANGAASGYYAGIELVDSVLTTDGGNLSLRGHALAYTPTNPGAGVILDGTDVDLGTGSLTAVGSGEDGSAGVSMAGSTITSLGGAFAITGTSDTGDGVFLDLIDLASGGGNIAISGYGGGDGVYLYGDIDSDGGDVSIDGSGGEFGVYAYMPSGLQSGGGDIVVHGEGGSEAGTSLTGGIDSAGGDITLYGSSIDAEGLVFRGNYPDGILSAGGAIDIRGYGATAGAVLMGSGYGTSSIDGGGGPIVIIGTASATDAVGVELSDLAVIGLAGDVTIDGSAAAGIGILFQYGASVSTTTGAIGLYGTGADFGLDIADGALETDSGDITLDGTATAADAVAGVRVTGDGLQTNGGDITVTGSSAGGVGVQLGDGSDPFAIGSGGGAIMIEGTGVDAVLMQNNQVASGGGAVSITGSGNGVGVSLDNGSVDSAGGDIAIEGTASDADGIGVSLYAAQLSGGAGDVTVRGTAAAGIGIALADGSGIDTTTGAIGLYGTGADFGLDIADGALETDSGDITLDGTATAADAVAGVRVTGDGLQTNGGDITVTGSSAGGVGVQLGDGSDPFAIGSGGGAIAIEGTGVDAGVLMQNNQVASGGGAVSITGDASGADASGVELTDVTIASGAGDIRIEGTAEAGTGVLFAGGGALTTTSGAITVIGTGLHGLNASDVPFSTDTGSIHLEGHAQQGTGLSLGTGGLTTQGGDITLVGETASDGQGVQIGGSIASNGGAIRISGTSGSTEDFNHGVLIQGSGSLDSGGGDIDITGDTTGGIGIWVDGVAIASHGGDVGLEGSSSGTTPYTHGVALSRGAGIDSAGGDIHIIGASPGAGVLMFGDVALSSASGDIVIEGTSSLDGDLNNGIRIFDYNGGTTITSTTGNILLTGTAGGADAFGVDLGATTLSSGAGNISVVGAAVAGTGVALRDGSAISTATGDIQLIGTGASSGMILDGGEVTTTSGHLDLRGRATAQGALGLRIGSGAHIATQGGGIELSGEGNGAAGLSTDVGSSIDAGDSLVVLRAATSGNADAIVLGGTVHSGVGVNLRPGGVGAAGDVYERVADQITIGTASGFSLSAAELALIDTPELIIGSNLHAGAIRVLGAISRDGNLTLQNDGGSGGIDLQAALDVGDYTLALSSGGSITQTSAGAVTAHSLLAQAAGDVLLANALNDVASTTLAGSAGGDFEFQDANTLAIGSVSAIGFDATEGELSSVGATGVTAGGDALVRNLQGDLTLNAGVTATNIDLVTAGRLQNAAGASLVASGDWRVWASTWEGETRGGLAGDGNLPNLYGCAYLGACGVTVNGGDNHFIYVQQPIALITFDNATREYGLPNPLFTFSVTGAILGDTAANVAAGSASTTATIGSDVGNYAITGTFASAAGYRIQLVPGTLAITPATLLFTADGAIRYLGFPNPDFTGTVTGFRNGDTVASVFGDAVIWSSPAGPLSPIGYYPVIGGTSARNYVFAQAEGNLRALQIIPLPQLPATPIEFVRETVNTYVYDRNFGGAPVCAVNASIDDTGLASSGDGLSTEWSKVRSRPNLTNCFDSERENGCGSF